MTGQLPEKYMDQLESWIGTGPKIFTLLYKITRDGCSPTDFDPKCDSQGPTVTVLYNQQGSVYGGYGCENWHSAEADIQGGNAFLFQLKCSGSEKFTKLPIVNAAYGKGGRANNGPLFGAYKDLNTFKGTIDPADPGGGIFTLNGQFNVGILFKNHGLPFDEIGTKAVTYLEVYRVRERAPQPTQPWRKTPEWNKKYLETLTEDIVSFKPSTELELSDVRILMLGPVGTGKSSFYNTVNSVFKGRISQSALCGVATNGITLANTPYEVKVRSGATLNFRLCDTRGLEVTQGLDILECNFLLDGNIPDHYEFNPAASINSDNSGFVHQPKLAEKIHCVLFVLDTASVHDMPAKLVKKMQIFQRLMIRKGIPQAVLLTKIDMACQHVASYTSKVFTSMKIEDAVDKVSGLLGLPRNNILPVKNYEDEMQLDDNISILALLALRQLLNLAEDYVQVLQAKMNARNVANAKPNTRDPSKKETKE